MLFRNGPHLNLPTRPTDYMYQIHQFIHNCPGEVELSQTFRETEPWCSYKGDLTIESYAGIEMLDGMLVASGASRTCFESIVTLTDYSPVNNRVSKVANG